MAKSFTQASHVKISIDHSVVTPSTGIEFTTPPAKRAAEAREDIATKYVRATERFTMLLSLISVDELKRIGLVSSEATPSSIDDIDKAVMTRVLDAKIEQFNAAHKRLTGQRRLHDIGQLTLSQDEFAYVMAARKSGVAAADVRKQILQRRRDRGIA